MEHIVQFGVTVDDTKIEQMIMEQASKECLKQIESAMKDFTRTSYYDSSKLYKMFSAEVKRVVEENKAAIIDKATQQVATNLMKTKAITEAKARLVDSITEEKGDK